MLLLRTGVIKQDKTNHSLVRLFKTIIFFDPGQKYYAPQVQPDRGSNS